MKIINLKGEIQMNKKYLIGFELYLMEDSYFEDEQKLSFEFIQEVRKFFMKYYNARKIEFTETLEAYFSLTIEPIEVKLTSTGNDNDFKNITKTFEDIYSKFCNKSGYEKISYLVSPIYFTPKNWKLTICRECFADLDVALDDVGTAYYYRIFKEDIEKCREYYHKYIMLHPDMEIDAHEDIMF